MTIVGRAVVGRASWKRLNDDLDVDEVVTDDKGCNTIRALGCLKMLAVQVVVST